MSDERELIAEREKKVEEILELGANPYANGFTPTHTAAELQAKFAGAEPPPAGDGGDGKGAPPALLSDDPNRSIVRLAIYAVVIAIVFEVFFVRLLKVQMPAGLFKQWLF